MPHNQPPDKILAVGCEVNILYLLCLTTIKNGYRRYPPYFQIQVERLGDLARSMITG